MKTNKYEEKYDISHVIDNRGNVFFKGAVVILGAIAGLFVFYNLWIKLFEAALFDFITGTIMMGLLMLYKKQRYLLSKFIFLLSVNVLLFLFALSYVTEVGLYLIYIPFIAITFAIFQKKHAAYRYGFTALSVLCMVLLLFSRPFSLPVISIEAGMVYNTFLVNLLASITVLLITLFYMMRVIDFTDAQIMVVNNSLLEKNNELNTAYSTLDKFSYSVSHDLRAPLSSIKGLSALGRMTTKDEETIMYFDEINKSAEKLDNFIKLTLNHYKDNLDIQNKETNIYQLIKDIVKECSHMDNASTIKMTVNWKPKHDCFFGNEILLRQTLGNVISNAIKYQDPLKTDRFITIETTYEEDTLHIKVVDNGKGIEEKHLNDIFKIFYTGNARTDKSTGVGLHLVQEAVAKMKGSVKVLSEVNKGTTFSISIPLSPCSPGSHDFTQEEASARLNLTA